MFPIIKTLRITDETSCALLKAGGWIVSVDAERIGGGVKKFLTVLSLLAGANPSMATENGWLDVTTTKTGSKFMIRESDAFQASIGKIVAWVKIDSSKDASTKYRESKAQFEFDCSKKTMARRAFVAYAANGTVVYSKNSPYDYHQPVIPDTAIEAVMEVACIDPRAFLQSKSSTEKHWSEELPRSDVDYGNSAM